MSGYISIKILAVTKMFNNICVAGIDDEYKWKRPIIKEIYCLKKEDIFQESLCVIKNYNKVKFKYVTFMDNNPHSEDVIIDPSQKPELLSQLSTADLEYGLNKINESSKITSTIKNFLLDNNRSLVLIQPLKITDCLWGYHFGKLQARIKFEFNERLYDYPCTDLGWRSFCMQNGNISQMGQNLNLLKAFFVIGLARKYLGTYHPMIVGIHTIPETKFDIDYNRI
jgi:hypothetical protein